MGLWHRQRESTPSGLEVPSCHLSARSSRCGFQKVSMMSLVRPSFTASASERGCQGHRLVTTSSAIIMKPEPVVCHRLFRACRMCGKMHDSMMDISCAVHMRGSSNRVQHSCCRIRVQRDQRMAVSLKALQQFLPCDYDNSPTAKK